MTFALPLTSALIGRSLRRWRRLNDVKQETVAAMLAVSQPTVSRWEAGRGQLTAREKAALTRMIGARADSAADQALVSLVANSSEPMHLVCDLSHRLLAASPGRLRSWRRNAVELCGLSLWSCASEDIIEAEWRLLQTGWHEAASAEMQFTTRFHDCPTLWIEPGTIVWTRIPLSNGTMARLVRDGADRTG
ncbi:XRE family transcriptional regulator [Jiella endophytica]|uniref:XRE family transcriptional regulator n=1 Tax=Jiella endophytica TaxID=2558362 RepID=A0A4Y8RD09_9HYPH|nr:helix-turn-helix transcriptional regulator [Jiella endophytica]TFF19844.1 XRE family transcriptional regulator [Jiella endophytica]